jgi:hypothetical protein
MIVPDCAAIIFAEIELGRLSRGDKSIGWNLKCWYRVMG